MCRDWLESRPVAQQLSVGLPCLARSWQLELLISQRVPAVAATGQLRDDCLVSSGRFAVSDAKETESTRRLRARETNSLRLADRPCSDQRTLHQNGRQGRGPTLRAPAKATPPPTTTRCLILPDTRKHSGCHVPFNGVSGRGAVTYIPQSSCQLPTNRWRSTRRSMPTRAEPPGGRL